MAHTPAGRQQMAPVTNIHGTLRNPGHHGDSILSRRTTLRRRGPFPRVLAFKCAVILRRIVTTIRTCFGKRPGMQNCVQPLRMLPNVCD